MIVEQADEEEGDTKALLIGPMAFVRAAPPLTKALSTLSEVGATAAVDEDGAGEVAEA